MSWPCVCSFRAYIQFSFNFFIYRISVLDPMGKMTYFKKNWPEELQDDVLVCAERVVCNSVIAPSRLFASNN
jgi:hypothetical protein